MEVNQLQRIFGEGSQDKQINELFNKVIINIIHTTLYIIHTVVYFQARNSTILCKDTYLLIFLQMNSMLGGAELGRNTTLLSLSVLDNSLNSTGYVIVY